MGCSSCKRTAPIPFELAFTDILTGLAGSKNLRMGVLVNSCLRVVKLASWCSVQCHSTLLSNRVLSGAAACNKFGMNFARYVTMHRNRCSCSLFSGLFIIQIAFTFSGSGFNPSLFRMCPM